MTHEKEDAEMIDFILGAAAASLVWWFIRQNPGAKASDLPGLIAQFVKVVETKMSQVADDLIAEIDSKLAAATSAAVAADDAKVADLQNQLTAAQAATAAVQAQLDAANSDLAAVKAHVDGLPPAA